MSQLRGFGLLSADLPAASQQVAILAAIYANRREAVEQLLGADGEILQWVHQRGTWPPSYALIRSGPERYFLAIEGTTNGWQLAGHINGSWGAFDGSTGSLVNGQWLEVWNTLWPSVRAALPDDLAAARVFISGHSYGGAVAQLGGMHLAGLMPADQVAVMTFGSPRVRTVGYEGPQAGATWRIRSSQDLVGYLPPEQTIVGALLLGADFGWTSRLAGWTHYGPDVWIGPAGDVPSALPAPNPLPDGVSVGPVTEHSLTNYRGRLAANYAANSGPATMPEALALAAAVLADAPLPEIPDGLPRVAAGPQGEPEPIPIYDVDGWFFTSTPERGSDMADEVPAGTRIWRTTHFFATGRQGWTEGMLWKVTGDGSPISALALGASAVNASRRKVMSSKVTIDGVRMSDESITGDADFSPAPTVGSGDGLATGAAAPAEMGWLFRAQAVAGQTKANYIYRGFPDALVYAQPEKGKFPKSVPDLINVFAGEMKAIFTGTFTKEGITVQPVIASTAKDGVDSPVVDIVALGVDADGYLTVSCLGGSLLAARGSKIRLHLDRVPQARGLSRRYKVVKAPVLADGVTTYSLDRKALYSAAAMARLIGKAQVVRRTWITMNRFDLVRGAKKDVGRPSFLSRGRAPARS